MKGGLPREVRGLPARLLHRATASPRFTRVLVVVLAGARWTTSLAGRTALRVVPIALAADLRALRWRVELLESRIGDVEAEIAWASRTRGEGRLPLGLPRPGRSRSRTRHAAARRGRGQE